MLASCAQEIKFHDWETTNCYGSYKPMSEKSKSRISFKDLSWSFEGTYLAAVQSSGKTMLLKPNVNPIFRNDPFVTERDLINVGNVKCAQFAKTQNTLVALGTNTGHIIHHNLVSKYSSVVVEGMPGSAHFINYAAGDAYLAVACTNGQIFIVQVGVGITESYFVPNSECITALATHPTNSKYMAGGSDEGVLAVWDVNSSCYAMQSTKSEIKVMDIAFSPTDETLTAIHSNQKIGIYDLRVGECVHEKHFDVQLTSIAYSPRGTDIAVGTEQGHILCMDKRYLRSTKTGLKAHDQYVVKIRFQFEKNDHFKYLRSPSASTCSLFQEPERERVLLETNSDILLNQPGDFFGRYQLPPSQGPSPSPSCVGLNPNLAENNGITPTQQAVEEMSLFHIIDERTLYDLKQNVLESTKELVDRVVDQLNNDFLKMRMNVSRDFCSMELRNRDRWEEFNDTLLKIACLDDQRLDEELLHEQYPIHEAAVRDISANRRATAKRSKSPPPDENNDISDEISYDENLDDYSDHILDQQEVELDEIDYMDNESRSRSIKQTAARVNVSQASGYPPAAPSTSRQSEESKPVSPRRYMTSKLPRHKVNTGRDF